MARKPKADPEHVADELMGGLARHEDVEAGWTNMTDQELQDLARKNWWEGELMPDLCDDKERADCLKDFSGHRICGRHDGRDYTTCRHVVFRIVRKVTEEP